MPTWHLFLDVSQTCKVNKDQTKCPYQSLPVNGNSIYSFIQSRILQVIMDSSYFIPFFQFVSKSCQFYSQNIPWNHLLLSRFHLFPPCWGHPHPSPRITEIIPSWPLFLLFSFNSIFHTEAWRMRFKAQIIKLYCII